MNTHQQSKFINHLKGRIEKVYPALSEESTLMIASYISFALIVLFIELTRWLSLSILTYFSIEFNQEIILMYVYSGASLFLVLSFSMAVSPVLVLYRTVCVNYPTIKQISFSQFFEYMEIILIVTVIYYLHFLLSSRFFQPDLFTWLLTFPTFEADLNMWLQLLSFEIFAFTYGLFNWFCHFPVLSNSASSRPVFYCPSSLR